MNWRDKLRRLTETRKLSELSRSAGLHPNALSDSINKGQSPLAEKAIRIARVLDVPTEWLFDDDAEWPPPPHGGIRLENVPDGQVVDELRRRRQLVRRDIESLIGRLRDPAELLRVERVFARRMPGKPDDWTERDEDDIRSYSMDFKRIVHLYRQMDFLSADAPETSLRIPDSPTEIVKGFPNLEYIMRWAVGEDDASNLFGKTERLGDAIPYAEMPGFIVSRERFDQMSAFQQWGYVPLLQSFERGFPAERIINIYNGQVAPQWINEFARVTRRDRPSFAFKIVDGNMEPELPIGSIVVCERDAAADRNGERPVLVAWDGGRRAGVYRVSGDRLLSVSPDAKPQAIPADAQLCAIVAVYPPATAAQPGSVQSPPAMPEVNDFTVADVAAKHEARRGEAGRGKQAAMKVAQQHRRSPTPRPKPPAARHK